MRKILLAVCIVCVAICAVILLPQLASAVTIESASVFPTEIEPGKTARITLRITNNLNEDLTDVSISLELSSELKELPFAPYDSSNEVSIEKLKEDEDESVSFQIIALSNSESGVYKIPIKISYKDENDIEHKKQSLISLTVNSMPLLGAEYENGLLLKNQNNDVVIKIINKGLSDIKFLEVDIGNSKHYNLLSQDNVYIGDIDSDDFDTAEFKIFFKDKSPSIVNLPVTLHYRDVMNKEYNEDYTINLKVYSKAKAIELGLLKQSRTGVYIGIVIFLIIIYIVYRKIKKRRKLKKKEK